jgi:hypothetical protein
MTENSFLAECAQKIQAKYKGRFDKICIVSPNERTKIYLNAALAGLNKGPQWALKMYGIKQLAEEITGLRSENKIRLIFTLYDIFKKHFNDHADFKYDLDLFYSLGEVILNDFNEIDNWLAEPGQIFRNIKNVKEIESLYDHLNDAQKETLKKFRLVFADKQSSKEKEKLLQIWNIMPDLYNAFRKKLLKRKKVYGGLCMREMSRMLKLEMAVLPKFDTFIFVGFNALTKAEMSLPKYLIQNGKAEYFQDSDAYYQFDLKQEAGLFIRKNTDELKLDTANIPSLIPSEKKAKGRKIDVYGAPGNIAQAKIVPKLLQDITNPGSETAVILADESLMMPALHALPQNVAEINIGMGISMPETKTYGLAERFMKIHKTDDQKPGIKSYSYKDITAILKHPAVYRQAPDDAEEVLNNMAKNNITAVPAKYLIENRPEIFKLLFTAIPAEDAGHILLNRLLAILFLIFERENPDELSAKESLENEAVFAAYKRINTLSDLLKERPENFKISFTSQLLGKILREISIPFKGKKVKGLQMLGVLETRNLDFKNLIILGMNEGNFPQIQHAPSFLTQSIRFAFGLPMVQYQDAVYAYLFYRLLQRSQKIALVYNNLASNEIGEKSRFIKQLEYESGFDIKEYQYYQKIKLREASEIRIEKDAEVLEKTEMFNFNGPKGKRMLSASAINTYINCPLQFYFKYIAGLREKEQADDEISPALFGEILHKAAEIMYEKISKKQSNGLIDAEALKAEKNNAAYYVLEAFQQVFSNNKHQKTLLEGKGQIVAEVLRQYLLLIIRADIQYAPFKIYSLEQTKNYTAALNIATDEEKKKVVFGGIIDRVDIKNDNYRIIDYKTGTTEKKFTDFEALFASENNYKYKSIIQMFLYGWMFKSKTGKTNIRPGIYDLKQMNSAAFTPEISQKSGKRTDKDSITDSDYFSESMQPFLEKLSDLLGELFNPDIPFQQTTHEENCNFCPYKGICGRK